jgi:Ca2+-binding EF-hand superfamily protein
MAVVVLVSVGVFAVVWSVVFEKADADKDGLVTTGDLFDFTEAFREHARDPQTGLAADLNEDGQVDERDIFRFLRLWNRDREEYLKEYQKGL